MDGRVGHEVPDIAHEHQRAAGQGQLRAVGGRVVAVGVEAAGHGLPALLEGLGEIALHEAEPVAVDRDLVLGVDGGDGVLAVLDRGDGAFQHDVRDAGAVDLADRRRGVDHDLGMEAVGDEEDGVGRLRRAAIAGELRGRRKAGLAALQAHDELAARDRKARGFRPRRAVQRGGPIEEGAHPGDDLGAARRVVAAAARRAVVLGNGVRAVERVVERAPSGIGRVQREAGVEDGHDELRPRDGGDLGIDVAGLDGEGLAFGHDVADLAQKRLGFRAVHRPPLPFAAPVVDPRLHRVADRQKLAIARGEIAEDLGKRAPEPVGLDPGAGQSLALDEVLENGGDLQAVDLDGIGHGTGSSFVRLPQGLGEGNTPVKRLG